MIAVMVTMTRIMNALILRVEGVRVSQPIIRLRGSYPPSADDDDADDADDADAIHPVAMMLMMMMLVLRTPPSGDDDCDNNADADAYGGHVADYSEAGEDGAQGK